MRKKTALFLTADTRSVPAFLCVNQAQNVGERSNAPSPPEPAISAPKAPAAEAQAATVVAVQYHPTGGRVPRSGSTSNVVNHGANHLGSEGRLVQQVGDMLGASRQGQVRAHNTRGADDFMKTKDVVERLA